MTPKPWELEQAADALLAEHARSELCRECDEPGERVGTMPLRLRTRSGKPAQRDGKPIVAEAAMYECPNHHVWFAGEGRPRGIGGDNAILFEQHIIERKKREIFTERGTPDPEIVSGLYHRAHPQGRRLNNSDDGSFYK